MSSEFNSLSDILEKLFKLLKKNEKTHQPTAVVKRRSAKVSEREFVLKLEEH